MLTVASSDLGYYEAVERNLKKYSKFKLTKVIYIQIWTFLASISELVQRYFNMDRFFVSISRQSDLEQKIIETALDSDKLVLRNPRSLREALNPFKYIPLTDIAKVSFKNFKIFTRLEEKGLINFLYCDDDMASLESAIASSIERTKKVLVSYGVSKVVMQNEHSPFEKIILLACRELNIKVIVIAHGFIQDHYLITIAPIRADALVVWSLDELKLLSRFLPKCEREKLRYFGWPFPLIQRKNIIDRYPLFILTDVNFLSDKEFDETVKFIHSLQESFANLRIRPHPANYLDISLNANKVRRIFSNQISDDSLNHDLSYSSFVIGNDSSVLVHAAQSGIPSFQLKCTLKNNMPGVIPIESPQEVFDHSIDFERPKVEPIFEGLNKIAFSILNELYD